MDSLAGILPLLLIVLVFWLLVIRPARKRQLEMSRVQSSIEIGSQVMLSSGFYGTVVSVADDTAQVELAPGTTVKIARQAVVKVIDEQDEQARRNAGEDESPKPTEEQ